MDKELVYTMDINNQVYNTMYDDDSRYVYNFISGRTLWYLYRITLSFLHKGLTMEEQGAAILNMVYGLIGLGTNTFTEKQRKAYLKSAETLYRRLYDVLSSGDAAKTPVVPGEAQSASLDFRGKSVADAINEWVLFHESSVLRDLNDLNLESLVLHIRASYGGNAEDTERLRQRITHNRADLYTFSNDMQRLDYLIGILEEELSPESGKAGEHGSGEGLLGQLHSIREVYTFLRDEAMKLMMKNTG
jgi:hypothetical protein